MAIQFKVLTVAVPLWLVGATTAPHWLVSGAMLANTVIVVGLQVRASRGIDSPRAVRRAEAARAGTAQSKSEMTPRTHTVTKAMTPTAQPTPASTPPTVHGSSGASYSPSASSS
ncbi:hypothetical protein SNARM312S_00485 [Streptomyces narbonensis]